jgi:hypothetical protein
MRSLYKDLRFLPLPRASWRFARKMPVSNRPTPDRGAAADADRVFEVRATAADFVRQYDAHRILPMGNLVSKHY